MTTLLEDVLAGNRRAIAKMMSMAESSHKDRRADLAEIYRHAGKAHIVGITGVPGSGKSTLVQALAKVFRTHNKRVGIVAVDPSSSYSGGAIMGDRVRMGNLAMDDGVFIRSLATRGALGGLARACLDTVDVLDAAGFDIIMIETVGVGQDEIDIASAAHSIVVVSAPGLGDGVQAIKAGVLEIADIHVVSKSDKPDASATLADLKSMVTLGMQGRDRRGWDVPVVQTSAETNTGIVELGQLITSHSEHLDTSGERVQRQCHIAEMRILKTAQDRLRERLEKERGDTMSTLVKQAIDRSIDPAMAADRLIQSLQSD